MDLNEHTLTEAQRTLKRLGVTHLFRPQGKEQEEPSSSSAPIHVEPPQEPASQIQSVQTPSAAAGQPLPLLLRSLFHGKQSPVRTMWTYAGLHEDLQCATNPPRLAVFKKIQESVCQHLKWHVKDICSWPLDLDSGTFRRGLEHFKPQMILLFQDRETANDTTDAQAKRLQALANCRIVKLPSLEEMAQGNQQVKNEAWKILQTI